MSIFLSYIPSGTPPESGLASTISNNLLKLKTEILFKKLCCESVIDIDQFVPGWIQEQKNQNVNSVTVFDFIQKYYDWLYCTDTDRGGSGYLLDTDLEKITDIEEVSDSFRSKLNSIYFPYFKEDSYILRRDGGVLGRRVVSEFTRSIKTKFLIKKGSPESCDIFFTKLFGTTGFRIDYSRDSIVKLNGGFFAGPNGFSGTSNLGLLNKNRLQNGREFTEYSYVVNATGITAAPELLKLYENVLHPAGTNFYFNFDLTTVTGDGGSTTTTTQKQTPNIRNYSAYRILGVSYGGNPQFELVILGITYYGLTGSSGGCSLIGTFRAPSYVFPSWSIGMTGQTGFQDMEIRDMYKLEYSMGATNPNINIAEDCD